MDGILCVYGGLWKFDFESGGVRGKAMKWSLAGWSPMAPNVRRSSSAALAGEDARTILFGK